jgi:hypothetical protein
MATSSDLPWQAEIQRQAADLASQLNLPAGTTVEVSIKVASQTTTIGPVQIAT